jgi:hypothetical protein
MANKRKVTITLDEDIAQELEAGGNVSAQLNDAARDLVERRRNAQRLQALLDKFDAEDGPLPDDPEEDARIRRLLGGVA